MKQIIQYVIWHFNVSPTREIKRHLGGTIASPNEARSILGLG